MTGINNGFVEVEKTQCSSFGVSRSGIGLAVVPVKVKAEGSRNVVVTHSFLDGGSNSTFCTEALLKQLGLDGKKTEFSLTNFCNREFSECIADSELGPSQDDQRGISIMKKSVKVKDNHYGISLPWRDDQPCLPNSRAMALHRLGLLKKRLQRNPELYGRYSTVNDNMLSKGYAQKVPEEEHNRQDGFAWYLPHHPVHHPLKPDKTRVVFDCSARYRGTSLNDKLLQGPDLTNSLVGVLTQF